MRLLIVTLAASLLVLPRVTAPLDELLRDTYLRLLASAEPEHRLTVVDIDETSLAVVGSWPWSRDRIAELVEQLIGHYRARAVGIDMVFPEPGDIQGDARLAALAAHAPLILAQILDYRDHGAALAIGTPGEGFSAAVPIPSAVATGHIASHEGLASARCVGNIGYTPDADGVLRRLPLVTRYGGALHPHFALAILQCAQGAHDADRELLQGMPAINDAGFWRVAYRHRMDAYTVIPAADILDGSAPAELLRDRYILIGSSALSLGDRVSTPLAPLNAGVLVHATALAALLDELAGAGAWPDRIASALAIWVLMTIALVMWWMRRLTAWLGIAVLIGCSLIWLLLAGFATAGGVEFPLAAPLFAYFLLLGTAVPHEWWLAQRRNRRLINTLSHYVAEPVLDQILRRGLPYGLDPVLCDVTVLIADMENYTQTTSSLTLGDAATLTKGFLECLTRPVLTGGGTLDKYTGDGLVAFWGAPLPCEDQADRAAAAALTIFAEVANFNRMRTAQGFPPVTVRVGIESGRALVGDLGTPFRSTYTAVGDCINHASRLESAARTLPSNLVIGRNVVERLVRHRAVPLGAITLRGTGKAVEVFTLADKSGQPVALAARVDRASVAEASALQSAEEMSAG